VGSNARASTTSDALTAATPFGVPSLRGAPISVAARRAAMVLIQCVRNGPDLLFRRSQGDPDAPPRVPCMDDVCVPRAVLVVPPRPEQPADRPQQSQRRAAGPGRGPRGARVEPVCDRCPRRDRRRSRRRAALRDPERGRPHAADRWHVGCCRSAHVALASAGPLPGSEPREPRVRPVQVAGERAAHGLLGRLLLHRAPVHVARSQPRRSVVDADRPRRRNRGRAVRADGGPREGASPSDAHRLGLPLLRCRSVGGAARG